mgnify:CR=1 FL=1
MALKSKFERIDQSKLKQGARDVLAKMKDKSENFTNAEVNKKIEPAIDKLIERLKKENPDALKKASATRTRKPKATAKKKPTKKAPAKKGGAKRETVMTVAKRIRKDGEKWQDALKRAKSEMGKDTKKKVSAVKTEVDKLKQLIEKDAVLKGFSNSELQRDAVRKAKPRGKRKTSTKGETTNQYGTYKNKVGRTYWESRENRSDRYAPKYPKNKPFLEMGGDVTDAQDLTMANADFLVMAKGGTLYGDGKMYKYTKDGVVKEVRDINSKLLKEITIKGKKYRRNSTYKTYNSVEGNELLNQSDIGNKMAKGGEIYNSFQIKNQNGSFRYELEKFKNLDGEPFYQISSYKDGSDVPYIIGNFYDENEAIKYFNNFKSQIGNKMAKGGEIDAFTMSMVKGVDDGVSEIETKDLKARMEKGGEIDLFEDYEKQPKELAEIVEVYEERYADGDMDYESTKEFLDKVNAIGYTFDAGLDNEPYNLRPMMAKGGEVNEAYIDYMNKDKGFKTDRKYFKTYEDAEKWARNEFERFNPDMISYTEYETPLRSFAKGGRLKSALMRDRKYYNKNESWERSYSKSKNRKGYKERGGQIGYRE